MRLNSTRVRRNRELVIKRNTEMKIKVIKGLAFEKHSTKETYKREREKSKNQLKKSRHQERYIE